MGRTTDVLNNAAFKAKQKNVITDNLLVFLKKINIFKNLEVFSFM